MITKYKIRVGFFQEAKIEKIEVLRETAKYIFVPTRSGGERRESKMSSFDEYHDTWEAAHSSLTELAERNVANARRALEIANSFAGNVKGMKPTIVI